MSLLALAVEWCSKQTCTEQTRAEKVIYFTSSTLSLPEKIVRSYLVKYGYSGDLNELNEELISDENTEVTLLLDAGRTDSFGDYCKILDQFKPILNGAYPHIIVIMALSSGQGGIFNILCFL